MKCLECNRDFKKLTYAHLAKCCGLTEREYLVKHPGAGLVDDDLKKMYGLPLERNPNWRGGISKSVCKQCGVEVTQRSRIQYCRKCSQKIKGNPFAGRQHSAETRQRMSDAAKKRDPTTYKGGAQTAEQRRAYRKAYWDKIPPDERSAKLTAFIEAGQKCNKKNSKTRIENRVAEVLRRLDLAFARNVQIGRYNVDFVVGGRIVECYGDYWHCNPQVYVADYCHKGLHMTAQQKWHKDKSRVAVLKEAGYGVICLWEYDINNFPDAVEEQLRQFLKEK